jgi:hypothetical protein
VALDRLRQAKEPHVVRVLRPREMNRQHPVIRPRLARVERLGLEQVGAAGVQAGGLVPADFRIGDCGNVVDALAARRDELVLPALDVLARFSAEAFEDDQLGVGRVAPRRAAGGTAGSAACLSAPPPSTPSVPAISCRQNRPQRPAPGPVHQIRYRCCAGRRTSSRPFLRA